MARKEFSMMLVASMLLTIIADVDCLPTDEIIQRCKEHAKDICKNKSTPQKYGKCWKNRTEECIKMSMRMRADQSCQTVYVQKEETLHFKGEYVTVFYTRPVFLCH